jgi:hypothetical protein
VMSLTNELYRAARISATGRAARRGPAALSKRMVRRRIYRTLFANLNRATR